MREEQRRVNKIIPLIKSLDLFLTVHWEQKSWKGKFKNSKSTWIRKLLLRGRTSEVLNIKTLTSLKSEWNAWQLLNKTTSLTSTDSQLVENLLCGLIGFKQVIQI